VIVDKAVFPVEAVPGMLRDLRALGLMAGAMEVHAAPTLSKLGPPHRVPRRFWARLRSRPWRRWDIRHSTVPNMREVIVMSGLPFRIYAHPKLIERLANEWGAE
jgi:hypothetical protein